ncbi:hypothetical protein AVEN_212207-1 [Araneus ventricosus]|uniref:Uncharacterized protein n=1 Tax=Araneus ventricosus TaxID=182803 RepID=A0A4Y2HTJ3_ARAVE|nr:hypothetical protein AVEN_212207-1 [Araneus ventricosus]
MWAIWLTAEIIASSTLPLRDDPDRIAESESDEIRIEHKKRKVSTTFDHVTSHNASVFFKRAVLVSTERPISPTNHAMAKLALSSFVLVLKSISIVSSN